jgi:HK97 family phage portal protein
MSSAWVSVTGAIKNLAVAGGGFGPLFNEFMGIRDSDDLGFPNTDSGLKDAYLASLWAARCIRIRAKALAGIPMAVKDFQGNVIETDNTSHPDYQWSYVFSKRANRTLYLLETQLLIWGKAFIRPHTNQRQRLHLHLLNPQTMEVKADEAGMLGFIQRIDGQISGQWAPEELMYFYDFNPDDDLGGRSPNAWVLDTIATDIGIERFVKTFFENDATPGGLLTTVENMQDPDAQRYAAWWKKVFGGASNAHKTAILGKGLTYQQITPNIKDMDVTTLDERTKRRIAGGYDVPMTIAGMDDAANYSTAQIQWRGFYTETVLPQADYIFDTVNEHIEDHGGRCYVEPLKDQIEALQEDRTAVTTQATTGLSGSVLSLNEARKMLNQTELKTDWFIIPTVGLVKRDDLEAGTVPQTTWETMPSQVPSGLFGNMLNPPPQAQAPQPAQISAPQKAMEMVPIETDVITTATASNIAIKATEDQSFCIMLRIGAAPELVALQERLKAEHVGTWEDPNGFHVTLLYANSVTPVQLAAMVSKLANPLVYPEPVTGSKLSTFDNRGDGFPLHVQVDLSETLGNYQVMLYQEATALGMELSEYSNPPEYHPHITMGYVETNPADILIEPLCLQPLSVWASYGEGYTAVSEVPVQTAALVFAPPDPVFAKKQRDLYVQDLKNWSKKVAAKGVHTPFHPDYLPSAYADFLRIDLKFAEDTKAVFTKAIEAFKANEQDMPTPEEFQAYWDGIGDLFETMEEAANTALDTLKGQLATAFRSGSLDTVPALLEQFDAEQLSAWLGTAEAPGALTKIILAGAARGNDLLNNARLSANPLKAAELGIAWDVVNQQAVEWARKFGSEQVRYINDTTRDDLNAVVANWVENGGSLSDLADAIEGKLDAEQMVVPEGISPDKLKWLTSPERAHLIAQTMTTDAFNRGVEEKWAQAGVKEVKFRSQQDSHVCPICKRLNNVVGTIAKGFYDAVSGKWYKIAVHPGCRCFAAPVV